jgi:hypothetical protein
MMLQWNLMLLLFSSIWFSTFNWRVPALLTVFSSVDAGVRDLGFKTVELTRCSLEEFRAPQVLDLLSKGKEIAKREQNLANRNLQFETNMDSLPEDPAATPATKADVDRLSALLLGQNRTITAQDKLIKSLNASKGTY